MKLLIIGGGENAGAIIDLVNSNSSKSEILGIVDDYKIGKTINGHEILYKDEEILGLLKESKAVVSYAADMRKRKMLFELISDTSSYEILISDYAYISNNSKLGYGSIVMPSASIRNQVIIGMNTLVNTGAIIDHGCHVGSHCHIAPGAVLTGNVTVGDCSFIGANATVLPNINIGEGSIVGAGSVVIKNVPSGEIWFGNPAKKIKEVRRYV